MAAWLKALDKSLYYSKYVIRSKIGPTASFECIVVQLEDAQAKHNTDIAKLERRDHEHVNRLAAQAAAEDAELAAYRTRNAELERSIEVRCMCRVPLLLGRI